MQRETLRESGAMAGMRKQCCFDLFSHTRRAASEAFLQQPDFFVVFFNKTGTLTGVFFQEYI